jgi:hypothetical protein
VGTNANPNTISRKPLRLKLLERAAKAEKDIQFVYWIPSIKREILFQESLNLAPFIQKMELFRENILDLYWFLNHCATFIK